MTDQRTLENALNFEHRLSRLETALMGDESMGVKGVVESVREVKDGQQVTNNKVDLLTEKVTRIMGWGLGVLTVITVVSSLIQVFK